MAPSSYINSPTGRTETLIGSDSRTMNPHTTIDVVIMLVIFLALIISLSVLAWRHPTSLGSLRVLPIHGAALPASNIAAPIATYWHSFPYLMCLRGTVCAIYHWWTCTSHNCIPSITISHYEHTVARAPSVYTPPVCIMRLPTHTSTTTTTTTVATSLSGASESMELHELDLDKGPSTLLLPRTDDADITSDHVGEPIVHACVGLVSEAHGRISSFHRPHGGVMGNPLLSP